jgi:biotin carboxyl carrier protein
MKIDHNIEAEKDCQIKEILAEENDPVDYGRPIFIIK